MLFILAIGLILRLKGIHSPLLDHPGWRQGDTASIARNFSTLQFNILYPQTNYDGPPPNYVELELQIVPFLAAAFYKLFGVHEIIGRLITIAFSLGTVLTVGMLARWLFSSATAGLFAAFFFATFPGSVYYGRTFTPDATMVFFLTAALYVITRLLAEDEAFNQRSLARATALLTAAFLAKPVALAGIVPVLGAIWERLRRGVPLRPTAALVLLAVPLVILYIYDYRVAEHAEWHWASGITKLHVLPSLRDAFTSVAGFTHKLAQFREVLGMLRATMLGNVAFFLSIASFIALRWISMRSKALVWGWLGGGIAYTYVVVTVERVDYYMYLLLPVCALALGAAFARATDWLLESNAPPATRYAIASIVPIVAFFTAVNGHAAVKPYYEYSKQAYANAVALDHQLDPKALVVIGHYGPDVLYYINRYGWEEDPTLWTPFDEESAIKKGARYFISIEDKRMRTNTDLCVWLSRFPRMTTFPQWPVYETDPAMATAAGEQMWRAYRAANRLGKGRAFLDAHHLCTLTAKARARRQTLPQQ